jgi:U3 small nucleolar ribonucleoprotein protein IMP4
MLRRLSRERREYIYRKSLESKEHEIFERKQKIRQLLAEGKPVPRNLTEGLEQEGRSNFGGMGGAAALRVDEGQTGECRGPREDPGGTQMGCRT